jgi:hypothetical protein
MNERDYLLAALIKEVLGPRGGAYEVLPPDQDPRQEYITGVLAPQGSREGPAIEAEAELLEEAMEAPEEDLEEPSVAAAPAISFSPALNPKALPHSIGLSFLVESAHGLPAIEICATWARYDRSSPGAGWQRVPECFLTGAVHVDRPCSWNASPGVTLHLYPRRLGDTSQYVVSLYLVNVTSPRDPNRVSTEELLFQPQLRVHCCEGTTLVPLPWGPVAAGQMGGDEASEDEALALLYREHRPMARGHLCGAVWRQIDPERPCEGQVHPAEPPYCWIDGAVVPETERAKFSPADVRSELVPCYPVEAPEMDWRGAEFPAEPLLDPERLAELWEPDEVRAALDPLAEGYAAWIERQRQHLDSLDPAFQPVARRHLEQCEQALRRIREGIGLVATDQDARLAFCFANRAIALQASWARPGRSIRWRPFQLAFILLNIPGIASRTHPDRQICDLLWFPTGGGKTEAYLGLTAFVLALRRRRASPDADGHRYGGGVGAISRYTLRLLTIQQFRRALGLITACEFLRVAGLGTPGRPAGWRPAKCPLDEDHLWGTARFAVGLWVGGNVTPNSLHSIEYRQNGQQVVIPGALDLLEDAAGDPRVRVERVGEPAQVLSCPACHWLDGSRIRRTVLAVPDDGLSQGRHRLHLVLTGKMPAASPSTELLGFQDVQPVKAWVTPAAAPDAYTLSLEFKVVRGQLTARQIDQWWKRVIEPALRQAGSDDVRLACARPSRPGYFVRYFTNARGRRQRWNFDLFCPNPECVLNQGQWAEKVPLRVSATGILMRGDCEWQDVPEPFRAGKATDRSSRIPIPACTVDDQIYHRCPSLVVATVDKFARLPFEPRAGSLFGVVDRYHAWWGYYRAGCPPSWGTLPTTYHDDPPGLGAHTPLHRTVPAFDPPDLILQDELHLIEGPLGSMVGLYETVIDTLSECTYGKQRCRPRYVASTATVRQAEPQVQALFDRTLAQFPPPALSCDDSFFARSREPHPLEATRPGRLYVGVCAPGRGAQTPIVRIWSALLQAAFERRRAGVQAEELDRFWTLVGYFNAIRELAGARALYRQDIPQWLRHRAAAQGCEPRPLSADGERPVELSSRADSLKLPRLLECLENRLQDGDAEDAILSTSMFGTGVDVERLGLMVMHGQPKTTAAYIQATGRVGRSGGGLVVVFLRASRPRDLDHYEYFTGYHRALYAGVEPITVAPFSPRARERALGPVIVALVRQAGRLNGHPVPRDLQVEQRLKKSGTFHSGASRLDSHRHHPAIRAVPEVLERRAQGQPPSRRPPAGQTRQEAEADLDIWRQLAQRHSGSNGLLYSEPALVSHPSHAVVLGDPHHEHAGLKYAYRNAPQSLREVEATIRFEG